MHRKSLVPLVALLAVGCASTAPSAPSAPSAPANEPVLVSSGTQGGTGYPAGTSQGPFTRLTEEAPTETYGYTPEEPIRVGGVEEGNGPRNQRLYMNALLGPEGQALTYERQGSCCPFEAPASLTGGGLLDVYEVTGEGLGEPIVLYLDMYTSGDLYIPRGLTARR